MSRRLDAGFSLLELIVVMAMATLLLSLIPPAFDGLIKSKSLAQQVSQIASELRLMRQKAVSEQQVQLVNFDLNNHLLKDQHSRVLHRLNPSNRLQVNAAASTVNDEGALAIRFYPDGSSSGGEIWLEDERQSFQVSVNWITGQISYKQMLHP